MADSSSRVTVSACRVCVRKVGESMITIREANDLRDHLFERLLAVDERDYSEYAAQHDVWPCVRKGAGERWLSARGETFKPSRSAALYFLRGKSAEAIMSRGAADTQEMVILNGVASHPDLSGADLEALFGLLMQRYPNAKFAEIKSTNYSSWEFYKLVQQGSVELALNKAFKMRNYFEQSANYATALDAESGLLIVFFLHGDYADRRTKCPQCGNALGEWIDDFYRECVACGYKTKKLDLWVYELTFDEAERARIRDDVFGIRARQFHVAQKADNETELLKLAPATPNHYCATCKVGKRLDCEHAGKVYE